MGSEWRSFAVNEAADVVGGGTPSTKDQTFFGDEIPWLTPKDLSGSHDRWVSSGERGLSAEGLAASSAKLLPIGSVLLTTRAPVGYVAIAAVPLATNQGFRSLVMRDGFDASFMYYVLKLNKPTLEQHASGSTFKELSGTALKRLRFQFPPLPEQRAIAEVLGSLDDKIELNRRMNRTLESMARALFRHHFLDHPDPAWEEKSLDEVADFLNGLACQKFPPAEGEPTLPVLKIAQLRKGDTGGGDRCNTEVPDKYVVNDGDVIFSWSGSLLVRLWTGGEAVLNQHLFKVTSDTTPRWFHYLWTCHHLDSFQQTAASKATTMGHIKRHHLTDAKVLLPSPTELDVIGETIEPLLARCLSNELQSRTLTSLRDTLLPTLLSGALSVSSTALEMIDAL